jgi:hypothetical protein
MKATRFQNNSKTLIDQILTSGYGPNILTGTVISDISDHFFTLICPNLEKNKNAEKIAPSRSFSLANLNNFKTTLGGSDWSAVTNSRNVDDAFDEFWSIYMELYELSFPKIRTRFNRNVHKQCPFMTNGLLISRQMKNKLYKAKICVNSPENIEKYRKYKTVYFKCLRAAKKLYFTSKSQANAKNSKKTWQTLNEVLGKERSQSTIDKIRIGDNVECDPINISNHFNEFFTSVGSVISNSIPPIQKQPEEFIQYPNDVPLLNLTNTTPEHVLKIIKSLAPKASCDVYGTSTKLIKLIGESIAIPLAHIFNLSLSNGIFPSKLKKCRVIPIFKSGDSLDVDNYRPISLLSSVSKIIEKIVAEKLINHLLSNDLLYNHQYGFLPSRSTEQNLIQVVDYISKALNENMYCIGVFLDLRKAFDVCSHEILLKKLKKMGILGTSHNWFTSYLEGRSQCVDIGGNMSSFIELAISVIQGSTLGPLLFLCYINDLWSASTLLSVLFADDTACLARGQNLKDLSNYVNEELRKIANWFRANKMALNVSKTKFIVFRTHNKPVNPLDCVISYNSTEIGLPDDPALISPIDRIYSEGRETSFKLLGVLLDEYLSFNDHISMLVRKISKSLYCINRVKNFVDQKSLRTMYFAMIHSVMAYGIIIYGCATKTNLDKLRIAQKKAIRIICSANYRAHTAPLFRELKILPLDDLITYSRIKFMHNFHFKKLPLSFAEMWQTNLERNPERELRNANDYYIPPHRVEIVKRLPYISLPTAWNSAPGDKFNAKQHLYLKQLKELLLSAI